VSSFDLFTAVKEATQILGHTDRIFLPDYAVNPDLSVITHNLKIIGKAAQKAGRKVNVIIIFSTEQEDASAYFDYHVFEDAYLQLQEQYKQQSLPRVVEENVRITGYQIFAYQSAKKIRS
jgi:hypothetical protein